MNEATRYWRRFLGIEWFKADHYFRHYIYRYLGITLPKLKEQKSYWLKRGPSYMSDFLESGFHDREVFFQNMLIDALRRVEFDSFFEAGCGFGWNLRRVKEDFPDVRVGGLDFSEGQLANARKYLAGLPVEPVFGDNCAMPFPDDHFDVGFSLGVFMNIHASQIESALREMVRVSKKYIIHLEYDENHTTEELREKRRIKRNIVSHDYLGLYKKLGQEVVAFHTYEDFGDAWAKHQADISSRFTRWQPFEGPEKYIFIMVKVDKAALPPAPAR